ISGYLSISNNDALTSLTGLENLTYIGEYLEIYENWGLISLTGLENLETISGYLSISNNDALTSLTGLENLTYIGEYLEIYENWGLISLTGLENLETIGGYLSIGSNLFLSSLTGLDNINAASINDLEITYNSFLASCEVQSICDFLASPNGTIEIYGNAPGCNSIEEIDSLCNIMDIHEFTTKNEVMVFPNPTKNEIFISGKDGAIIKGVNIYNQIGQRVIHKKGKTNTIDVSMLQKGMYIIEIEIEIDNRRLRSKLMIE
ncbi:MAG: hypothetical protein DRJ05_18940, partial [Bacteroidetes bacterium]